ncbi:unnamed protein product [Mytilus edulis]|uniref:Uncharacterized protein n=1 Tax=Mytilus edulis TaxID=6550 RepID=A0A8S3V8C4_MYTED|nr:unnamed protein product [Mytilus edulis]
MTWIGLVWEELRYWLNSVTQLNEQGNDLHESDVCDLVAFTDASEVGFGGYIVPAVDGICAESVCDSLEILTDCCLELPVNCDCRMTLNVVTFMMLVIGIDCFNIDTNNVVNIHGPEGTYFGYSAVMFSNEDSQKWVVVGAIKANFTNNQNIKSPGNIFKCKLNFTQSTQDTCEPMDIRTNGK